MTKSTTLKSLFLLAIILAIGSTAFGQTKYTYTDTVCAGSQDVVYGIMSPDAGSTYLWTLTGGGTLDTTIVSGATDSIVNVDWGAVTGTYNLSVIEQTSNGCYGDTVSLDIVLSPIPTMTLLGDSVCSDGGAVVQAEFTGTAPWIFEYTDGTSTWTDTATVTPWTLSSLPAYTTSQTISVNSLQDGSAGCQADPSTLPSTTIYIYPKPTTGAIFHY